MERIDLVGGSDEFGSTTLPLNKDYSAQMSEVRITHPSVVFFLLSAAIGKAQPRERSAREGLPAEATQCLGPTWVTSPELTSPSIELPFAS